MNLTTSKILDMVIARIRETELGKAVPVLYRHHYPNNPSGEFIVVTTLDNTAGGLQVASVNVNIYVPDSTPTIYVPDSTPTIGREEQRYPDDVRLKQLSRIAYESLACYPLNERWFFDVEDEALISEENISYTFSNIKIKLKRY